MLILWCLAVHLLLEIYQEHPGLPTLLGIWAVLATSTLLQAYLLPPGPWLMMLVPLLWAPVLPLLVFLVYGVLVIRDRL